ncbi:MAG TPA: hemerythrin domain-containing protein [Cryomorphaceae bacterium]|nr:hemerythrin domain-containing protein [Cryomorphaceae bacterium]
MQTATNTAGDFYTAKIRARYTLSNRSSLDEDREALIDELRICLNDPRSATPESFEKYGVATLVEFLSKSHAFYINYALPSLQRSINELIRSEPQMIILERASRLLMHGFTEELTNHFTHEETYLFKYAMQLSVGQKTTAIPYSLCQFRAEHGAFSVDIEKVITLFEMYRVELAGNMAYRIVVQQLENLKADMDLHGLIEDQVLLPKIEKLES